MGQSTIKKLLAAGAVVALLLVGCGAQEQATANSGGDTGGFFLEKYQKLSDGRTVLCLYKEGSIGGYSSGTTPAMDCDWAGAVVHP